MKLGILNLVISCDGIFGIEMLYLIFRMVCFEWVISCWGWCILYGVFGIWDGIFGTWYLEWCIWHFGVD